MPKFIPPFRLLPSALCLLPAVPRLLPAALCLLASAPTQADFFGTGENRFEIPFVTIGAPGNAPDTTGVPNPAGQVNYEYRIGKYEIPEEAIRKANAASGLAGTPLNLTLDTRGPQKPATSLSWFEAARFVNWLNTDTGNQPAYKFDSAGAFQLWTPADPGYNPQNPFRNALAVYVLPSVDEWYKAAYYDAIQGVYWDYPTGSDTPPTPVASGTDPGTAVWNQTTGPADVQLAGGASPFGTVGQGGNVVEWEETAADLINNSPSESRGARGGSLQLASSALGLAAFARINGPPASDAVVTGFRVARIPEPAAAIQAVIGLLLAAQLNKHSRCFA